MRVPTTSMPGVNILGLVQPGADLVVEPISETIVNMSVHVGRQVFRKLLEHVTHDVGDSCLLELSRVDWARYPGKSKHTVAGSEECRSVLWSGTLGPTGEFAIDNH